MDLSESILGHTAAVALHDRIAAAILVIGRDRFTRAALAGVECFNYVACARLQKVIDDLKVRDVRDLYERITPADLAVPGLGVVTYAVLGSVFEAKGIGGGSPLETWVKKHLDGKTITINALKHKIPGSTTATAPAVRRRRRTP